MYLLHLITIAFTLIFSNVVKAGTSQDTDDCSPCGKETDITESALIKKIFSNYDKNSRPVRAINKAVVVVVDLYPIITEQLEWEDDYLRWNMSEWSGVRYVTVSAKDIWTPKLVIGNSAGSVHGEIVNSDSKFRVTVSSNGIVSMVTAGETQTSCLVDITYFPFDYQTCYVQIESWSDGDSRVKLVNKSSTMDLSGYRVGGQWYVIRTEVSRGEHVKEFETYTNLMFIMYLRRKPLYYVFNIVLPSVILALLALLVFMLPPEAGEKMSLGITVLLSFTVFQLLVADSMPKTSDFIPIIAIYITSTMMMTAFSLLLSVVILSLHYHWPDEDVSPRCKTVADFFARLLCVKTYWSSTCPADRFRVDAKAKNVFKSMTWNGSVHYEPNHDPLKQSLFLEKILDDLKYLRGTCEELEASSARRRDWVQLARVFDRFLLAIFLVFNLVMIVTIFLIVPHTKDNRSTLRTLVTPEMF